MKQPDSVLSAGETHAVISARVAIVVLVIASLVPLSAALRFDHRFPSDDALISLTYAKNLAAGHGFVFNQPPPVLATTTPAFTMAVALLVVISGLEPTVVALWVSAMCWLGLVWSFFCFRRNFGLDVGQAAMIGGLLAAQGWVEHLSMEAYPFALILVLATAMVWSERWFLGGLAIGLLFLTRGEGVLFGAILGLIVLIGEIKSRRQGRSSTMLFVVGAALPVLGWSAYALPTFGSILPATLAAKMAQVASGLWAPFPVRLISEWIPGWGMGTWGLISIVLGYLLVGVGLVVIGNSRRRMIVFPAWGLAYAAGYSVLGVPGYPWYRLPIYFVLTVVAALGMEMAVRKGIGSVRTGWFRPTIVGVSVVAIVVAAGARTAGDIRNPPIDQRGQSYRQAALWLNDHAEPGQSVAFFEVGTVGYYSDLAVVDLVGLVTPAVIPYVLNRDFSSGFWELDPDFLIQLQGSEFTRGVVEDPRFSVNFVQAASFEGPGDRWLKIYRRRSTTSL